MREIVFTYCSRSVRIVLLVLLSLLCANISALASPSAEAEDTPAIQGEGYIEEEPIRYKQKSVSAKSMLGKVLTVFFLVVAAGLIALVVFRKKLAGFGLLPTEKGKHLVLLDRQQLQGDHGVYYLSIDGKKHLLVVGNGHSTLTEISNESDI